MYFPPAQPKTNCLWGEKVVPLLTAIFKQAAKLLKTAYFDIFLKHSRCGYLYTVYLQLDPVFESSYRMHPQYIQKVRI
jgi:hypothetical protein